jgi:putative transposase
VAQRTVARRARGGANRRKAVNTLQRVHRRVATQRRDFVAKLAVRLVREHGVLVLEDLRVRNLVRNRHLAKSILDRGWTYLLGRLSRKAEADRHVILVATRRSAAPGVGAADPRLRDRWLEWARDLNLDRDTNAARNILAAVKPART